MADEVEIKYRLAGDAEHERLRAALRSLGAEWRRREHEHNWLFDTPTRELDERASLLRLRVLDGGPRGKLTFKGPARYDGLVKSRAEIETEVADATAARALIEALGYQSSLDYEKERETWQVGEVEVVLDTLAFGHFCELEGEAGAITALALKLGLDASQAESRGYPTLIARHRAAGG